MYLFFRIEKSQILINVDLWKAGWSPHIAGRCDVTTFAVSIKRSFWYPHALAHFIDRIEGGGQRLLFLWAGCIVCYYQPFLLEEIDHLGCYHGGKLVCYVEIVSHIECKIIAAAKTGLGDFLALSYSIFPHLGSGCWTKKSIQIPLQRSVILKNKNGGRFTSVVAWIPPTLLIDEQAC